MKAFSTLFAALFQILFAYVLDYAHRYLQRISLQSGEINIAILGQFLVMLIFVGSLLWLTKYVVSDNSDNLGLQFSLIVIGTVILIGTLFYQAGRGFVSRNSPLSLIWSISLSSYAAISCATGIITSLYSVFAG